LISEKENIEIIISDNASGDDTQSVVSGYQKRFPGIRYYRNEQNVYDKNFFLAAGRANGKYLWIIGDDDRLEKDAIPEIFKKIRLGYDLIIVNHSIWVDNFTLEVKSRVLLINNDKIFTDHNALLSFLGPRTGFISSVIINRRSFLRIGPDEYEHLLPTGFSFMYSVYSSFIGNGSAYLIARPLIKQTGTLLMTEPDHWYNVFAKGSALAFQNLKKRGYSRRAIYTAKKRVLRDYILHDIIFRKRNNGDLKGNFKTIYSYYNNQWFFWLVIVPAFYSPRALMKCFTNLYYNLFRKYKYL
jgi:glycosyltransferase involved in cell wall biosynthesis